MKVEGINLQGRWIKSETIDIESLKRSMYWRSVTIYLNLDKPVSIYLRNRDETYAVFGFDKISDKKCVWFVRYGQIMGKKIL